MRTNKKTDYYKLLKKQGLNDAEIADAYILPMELTKEEEEENRRLLNQYRDEQRNKEKVR